MENCNFTIGRKAQVCLPDQTVSKQHAEISVKNGEIYLRDLNSTNGTFLVKNDRRVEFHEGLVEPDQIVAFGKIKCSVEKLLSLSAKNNSFGADATSRVASGSRHIRHPIHKTLHFNPTHIQNR